MFLVEISVWIEFYRSVIGVLANNHDSPGIARELHCLGHSFSDACYFYIYVSTASFSVLHHPFQPIFF